ncbi:hypothetical protein [Pseudogracilibacillus sp. SO30301A]|uniref:hypothetical protein n=1 Tax=Pseudogracilibacillus sp. SO30301A TaxID=3098291 RepID=UPI00300DC250
MEKISRLSLVMFFVLLLTVVVGCSNDDKIESDEVNTSNDSKEGSIDEEEDEVTEKDLVERILQESNKNNDRLLKEGGYYLSIDFFDEYRQESFIEGNEEDIEVITRVADSLSELENVLEEDYELSNGLLGKIGIDDYSNMIYIQNINDSDEYGIEINLGEIEIEEGKKILDGLSFRDESITEEELKESIGVDYENIKYYDNKGTDYEVSEFAFIKDEEISIGVVYYNPEGEHDYIHMYVSKNDFEKDDEVETVKTEKGKTVEMIDDGYYVEWFWEEDGYKYKISGNYDEEEVEEKDAVLDVIDSMTKTYGE